MMRNLKKCMPLVISMLLSGQILALPDGTLKGLIGLGSAIIALKLGSTTSDMNKEYTRLGKKPDNRMELFKLGAGVVTITALEIGFNKNGISSITNIISHVTTAALLTATTFCVFSNDSLAQFINDYAGPVAGFLAGPMDMLDGKEHKDVGTLCRTLLFYFPLRIALTKKGLIKDSSFSQHQKVPRYNSHHYDASE